MSKLPIIDARRMDAILRALGFAAVRQKGSHVFYRHADGRTTVVPNHPGEDLNRPLTRSILRDIDVTTEEYEKLVAGKK